MSNGINRNYCTFRRLGRSNRFLFLKRAFLKAAAYDQLIFQARKPQVDLLMIKRYRKNWEK